MGRILGGLLSLAQFQGGDLPFQLMQNSWAAALNPLIQSPLSGVFLLKNISLLAASNPNVVNHTLGRVLQGWFVTRQRASAIVWDAQDSNQMSNLTLNLRTSADVTVDLIVF